MSETVTGVRDAGRDRSTTPSLRAEELAARGVDGIALTYVDNTGITRVKAVPTARLEAATTSGVGMSPVFDVFVLDDSVTASRTSTGPVGDLRLYPDLDRLVELAAQPGWAWAPVDRRTRAGEVHPLCHRSFAARMVARAAEQGMSAAMSFELEWALDAGSGDEFTPATHGPAYGMTRLIDCSDYLRDVLRALSSEAIVVEQVHPEYAAGQFEVSIAPNGPVGAADDSVLVRQTIRAIGRNHGLRTSFSPSVVAGQVGNGGHLHASIWQNGRNLFAGGDGPHGMSAEAEAFTAGILRELPALLVIGAPSVASYLRLIPQHWSGAFQTWGLENRELGPAQDRAHQADQRRRGHRLHPRRRPQPAGALDRHDPRRPREGPARRALPHHPRRARRVRRGRPQAGPLAVRRQAPEERSRQVISERN